MKGDTRVWIKRHDCDRPNIARRLHALISFALPAHYIRASPLRNPTNMVFQEIRKINAFKAADIPVPELLCSQGPVLMLSDVGETIQKKLKKLRDADAHLHDGLLIQCADALGEVHAGGLCHGRPHPRDMFVASNNKIGFFDFEEEPEAVMTMAQAQARDAWLLFFQVSAQALDKERTPSAAFTAWRRHISLETLQSLQQIVRFFRFCVIPLKMAQPIWLGDDGKRMLSAMEFFIANLGIKSKL